MLKHRIIPTLLLKDGRMVKSKQFTDYRDVGNPVTAARIYNDQRTDELVFLDISQGTTQLIKIIEEVSKDCFMPFAAGGGIKDTETIRLLLRAGADKIIINSAAYTSPKFITEAAHKFGSSTICVSIDVKENTVWTKNGTINTYENPGAYAKKMVELGAGEIFLTSIERDGMMNGYDIDLIKSVTRAIPQTPLIISGGAGNLEHLESGLKVADAIAMASIFNFTDISPIKVRKYLFSHGFNVRS